MINEFEKNMEEIFDIDASVDAEENTNEVEVEKSTEKDSSKDYQYTRGQLYNLIEKGQEALNGALEVAQESGHPRAYEVAVNAMKQVADVADKLIDLQQKMKNLDQPTKKGPTTVNNSLFVGSTADLQKMLKEMNKKTAEDK